jgi:benzoyl-CoA reductase/2-hydroxyglutaryl-CoA dehydratase subunit BcrC/BadD/HgdB
MESKQKLKEVLWGRISELEKAKADGKILASGAIPVGLAKGGDNAAVENAGPYLPRWLDTFSRAQVGYMMMKYDPYYMIIDLYMIAMVDGATLYCASALECFTDLNIFKFEVPHEKSKRGLKYYLDSIYRFREKLENLTGNKIADDSLREAIKLCNRERKLLREISLLRKAEKPLISGLDFAKVVHASYIADKATYVKLLEYYLEELKKTDSTKIEGPRILLTGSTLASGDYKIHECVKKLGGEIVIEQYSEGLRDYWQDVSLEGDLMENLAERYLMKKICHGVFIPSRERLEFVVDLAKDFKADGVIWYQTMYRDAFDYEAIYFPDILKEKAGLSMIKLETDYDPTETGAFRTRIEAFFEIIRNYPLSARKQERR